MRCSSIVFLLLLFVLSAKIITAQTTDSTKNLSTFSGSIGFTNNGFSIIPTFSLNAPAANIFLAWRKKKI
jgi:hypothetical protein